MAKQYGDVVQLVRNGATINALVAMSTPQPDGEHLVVIFLDPKASSPQLGGLQLDGAIRKEFGVTPWAEGKPVGFKDIVNVVPEEPLAQQADAKQAEEPPAQQ